MLIGLFVFSTQINLSDLENKILSSKKKDIPNRTETCIAKDIDTPEVVPIFNENECDLISDGPICLYGGDRILLPFAKPKGIIGYWNFDEMKPLDNSGRRNHAKGITTAGPAFGGMGSSAFLNGQYIEVPHSDDFDSNDFTITFWLFVINDNYSNNKGIRFCPLLQRGEDNLNDKEYQRGPALYFDRKDRSLKVYVSTSDKDSEKGESLSSNGKVTLQRWLHIAVTKSQNIIKLYINGILDSKVELKGTGLSIKSSFYIGGAPWLIDECEYPFLIDELRYYNTSMDEDRIQAEASPVLGGIEPSFLQIGCLDCSLKEAGTVCPEDYRLCSSIELHTGAYQIARSLGLLRWDTHIWTYNALNTPGEFENLKGLALCCAQLK
jgi:hypothetical protein